MKQHRPRVSEESYNKVMANLKGRFGDNESFDSALSFLLDEHEGLVEGRETSNGTIKILRKGLNDTTDLLIAENKRAIEASWLAFIFGITAGFALIYIGLYL